MKIVKLTFKNVTCSYGFEGKKSINPVENRNFVLEKGRIYLLKGDNMTGKSTLLKALIGDKTIAFSGEVKIDEDEVEGEKTYDVKTLREHIKNIFYMPQRVHGIFPEKTLVNTVLDTWARLGKKYKDAGKRKQLYQELDVSKLIEETQWIQCESLSGGQSQMIALVLGILSNSKLVLLDEPTSAVSLKNKEKVINIIKKFIETEGGDGRIVIVATHDAELDNITTTSPIEL